MADFDEEGNEIVEEGQALVIQTPVTFNQPERGGDTVMVELAGRSRAVPAPIGADFVETIRAIAQRANYGDDPRVFLNRVEILALEDIPLDPDGQRTIQAGQHIAITPYDKPGR